MQLRSNFQVGQDTDIGGQSPLPVWFANQLFGWLQDSGWPGYVSKYDCRCDFDYASAIDIVSGAGARDKSFTELSSLRCYRCTGGSALNNEMKKDKRMRAVVGRAVRQPPDTPDRRGRRISLTCTPLMYINKRVTMIIMEEQELNFERYSQ